ncbi:MAG: aminotransferase class IV [Pirellula sp.]
MEPATSINANGLGLVWDHAEGRFQERPEQTMTWSVFDIGPMHGAILVERLRTFGGKALATQPHLQRLKHGLDTLGIRAEPLVSMLPEAIDRLVESNRSVDRYQPDASIVLLVAPGQGGYAGSPSPSNLETGVTVPPMCMLHLQALPWPRLHTWHAHGTPLIRAPWQSVAGRAWPAITKSRSRLNYYLSDRHAAVHGSDALALLSTANGSVADTSVANIVVLCRNGELATPKESDVLQGTSLGFLAALLQHHGQRLVFRDIAFEELLSAREVWLTGNSGCLWHACSLDGQSIGTGQRGPECEHIQRLWIDALGFDWRDQSLRMRG